MSTSRWSDGRILRISAIGVALLVTAVFLGLPSLGHPAGAGQSGGQGEPAGSPGRVVLFYGPGGVLTADGTLWQYRPDFGRWLTIDEAFREEGRTTHILPLPVPAGEIRDMESFGFLVTQAGQVWFYEIEADRWQALPAPGR